MCVGIIHPHTIKFKIRCKINATLVLTKQNNYISATKTNTNKRGLMNSYYNEIKIQGCYFVINLYVTF